VLQFRKKSGLKWENEGQKKVVICSKSALCSKVEKIRKNEISPIKSRPVRFIFLETRAGRGFCFFYSIFYSIKNGKVPKSYPKLHPFILTN
jgi:hypothetical protein